MKDQIPITCGYYAPQKRSHFQVYSRTETNIRSTLVAVRHVEMVVIIFIYYLMVI